MTHLNMNYRSFSVGALLVGFIVVGMLAPAAAQPPVPPGLAPGDPYHVVFVTKRAHEITPDPSVPPQLFPDFGGVDAADWIVTNAAFDAGWIPGWNFFDVTYTAVLSNDTTDAIDRVGIAAPLYNTAGQRLADGEADFFDGELNFPVGFDEFGDPVDLSLADGAVWTGSLTNGTGTPFRCDSNWNIDSPLALGTVGGATSRFSPLSSGGTRACSLSAHLYAISPLLTAPDPNLIFAIGVADDSAEEFSLSNGNDGDSPRLFNVGSPWLNFPGLVAGPDEEPADSLQPNENNPLTIAFESPTTSASVLTLQLVEVQNIDPAGELAFDVRLNDTLLLEFAEPLLTDVGLNGSGPTIDREIAVPEGLLMEDDNELVIQVTDGDWIAFDALSLRVDGDDPPPRPLGLADFDDDGDVDEADGAIWQATFGGPGCIGKDCIGIGDANQDGFVGGEDLMIWQREFGYVRDANVLAAAAANSLPAPEPGAAVLMLIATACWMFCRTN